MWALTSETRKMPEAALDIVSISHINYNGIQLGVALQWHREDSP